MAQRGGFLGRKNDDLPGVKTSSMATTGWMGRGVPETFLKGGLWHYPWRIATDLLSAPPPEDPRVYPVRAGASLSVSPHEHFWFAPLFARLSEDLLDSG